MKNSLFANSDIFTRVSSCVLLVCSLCLNKPNASWRADLSGEEGHGRAVDPGVVSRRRHPLQVILSFLRRDASARQLPVVHRDLISLHRLLHGNQRICQQQVLETSFIAALMQHCTCLI